MVVRLALVSAATAGQTQPAPDVTSFTSGGFDDLPLPVGAEPAGERTDADAAVLRSFFVRGMTPEQVLKFYADIFRDGQGEVLEEPQRLGTTAWRGRWTVRDRELMVSASPAPAGEGERVGEGGVITQFSLKFSAK